MSVGGSLRSTTYGYYYVRHLRSLIGVFLFSVGNLLVQDYLRLLLRASPSGAGCGVMCVSVGGSLRLTTHGYYSVRHLRSLIGVFFIRR